MSIIQIINGPNLNLLGQRDQSIYGPDTLKGIQSWTKEKLVQENEKVNIRWFQSNSEGEIIDKIHECLKTKGIKGIVINPGGYSHTSVSIMDALECCNFPIVEVHLSNVFKRENFRSTLLTARSATAIICGLGKESYYFAIKYILNKE